MLEPKSKGGSGRGLKRLRISCFFRIKCGKKKTNRVDQLLSCRRSIERDVYLPDALFGLLGGRVCHECGTWKASGGTGGVRRINSFPTIIAALIMLRLIVSQKFVHEAETNCPPN